MGNFGHARSALPVAAVLAALLGGSVLGGCSTTYQDESVDPLTRHRDECNGRIAVDYEYRVLSSDKDKQGGTREVRCESDLDDPRPNSGPRPESPISRG